MRRAAELATAGTDTVHDLGGVPGPDLPHLDAGVKLAGEIADQFPEIHPLLGVEVHEHAPRTRGDLDVDDLHGQAALAGQPLNGVHGVTLAGGVRAVLAGLALGERPQHTAVQDITLGFRERTAGAPHLADGGLTLRLHQTQVAHVEVEVAPQPVVVGVPAWAKCESRSGIHPCDIRPFMPPAWRGGSGALRR